MVPSSAIYSAPSLPFIAENMRYAESMSLLFVERPLWTLFLFSKSMDCIAWSSAMSNISRLSYPMWPWPDLMAWLTKHHYSSSSPFCTAFSTSTSFFSSPHPIIFSLLLKLLPLLYIDKFVRQFISILIVLYRDWRNPINSIPRLLSISCWSSPHTPHAYYWSSLLPDYLCYPHS